jgi:hypothetical protein
MANYFPLALSAVIINYYIIVTCPAPRHHTAKKTESACELVASAAGFNIYTLTIIILYKNVGRWA